MSEHQRNLLPKLPLDELLAELQSRLDDVRAARDSVGALLDAVVAIGQDLDLESVLKSILKAAKSLADARYAAMGVISEDRQIAEFIPLGLDEDQIAQIDHWPHGRGLLGLLIKEPQVLRLEDLTTHPESYGFPEGHPPMRRFLGVPIRIRDEVFGNLYLTDKVDGTEFDEQDEAIVTALATAAGVAIDNARLYEDTRAREIWLEASGEVTRDLLHGTASGAALQTVARRARDMAHADVATVILPDTDNTTLTVAAVDGSGANDLPGFSFPADESPSSSVLISGTPWHVTDASSLQPSSLAEHLPNGPAVFIPLGGSGRVRGVLSVHRRTGGLPITSNLIDMLCAFADQVAVAMELAEARQDKERYDLVDDRARIARDLHDLVIQRLFATAMTLTGAIRLIDKPAIAERIRGAVDDLDETIRQIRTSIFALQSVSDAEDSRLRTRLIAVTDAAKRQLGFAPGLRLDGLLDTEVSSDVADQVVAVAHEALSNVVRHARASHVDMSVVLTEQTLRIRVSDDGVGLPDNGERSGLANLEARARRLGGSFAAAPGTSGGTVLEWTIPV